MADKPWRNKSKRYQHKFREVNNVDSLDAFPDQSGESDEELKNRRQKRKEQILEAVFVIAEEQLTERQKSILYCRFVLGMTQVAIGEHLGVTQGCVSLQLNGVPNYTYNKKHGGILPKLKKMCVEEARVARHQMHDDEAVNRLLRTIKSRIRKAHPEYKEAEVVEKAIISISRMGSISELISMLVVDTVDSIE